ncbi:hypothetical protein [Marisediminicola sp. LYQ134]|uniref:hypothetical protein n=1 Tax=unclassified Marisediminicola TaxID=2618316 RepID=UPI0039836A55
MGAVARRLALTSLVVGSVAVLAGCGAGSETTADPAPSAAPSSPSASPSPSPEPSEPAAPAVDPATGPEFTVELTSGEMTIRAPEGYADDDAVRDPDGGFTALPADLRNILRFEVDQYSPFGDADLDVFATERVESPESGQPMERLPDVVAGGQTFYQIAGADPLFDGWVHEFGVRYDEFDIFIFIHSNPDTPQAERDATNASVLASVTLP